MTLTSNRPHTVIIQGSGSPTQYPPSGLGWHRPYARMLGVGSVESVLRGDLGVFPLMLGHGDVAMPGVRRRALAAKLSTLTNP